MASATDKEELARLKIFPNEVWDMILEHVKDTRHYHKISSALPYFRTRLLVRASQILFREVIEIFWKHNYATSTKPNQWIVARQVCRVWKEALDQVLQTQEYFAQKDNQKLIEMDNIIFDEEPLCVKYLRFSSAQSFAKFEEHFDSTHLADNVNPFVRRKVQFQILDVGEPVDLYVAALLRFLQKYGRHIRVCIIPVSFHLNADNLIDFFNRRLSLILELMSNLQALQIMMLSILRHDLPNPVIPASFPTLSRLEYVSIVGYLEEGYYPIFQQLLQRNPQVEYVHIMSSFVRANVFLECLPNIRALAFSIRNLNQFQHFANANFKSRVDRLWLDMAWFSETNAPVFEAVERQFSKSLVELYLSLPRRESLPVACRLLLPKLKILHLEMESPQRLDLLLPMAGTLEELHLAMGMEPDQQVNCQFEFSTRGQSETDPDPYKLQVYRFWKEPQKSNLWSFFPKLRLLETKLFKGENSPEKYRCTRKEWQAGTKAQN